MGFLVQLTLVLFQDMLGVMVGSQESHIVDLGPAALLIAQEMGVTPQEALESPKSSRCHGVQVTVAMFAESRATEAERYEIRTRIM